MRGMYRTVMKGVRLWMMGGGIYEENKGGGKASMVQTVCCSIEENTSVTQCQTSHYSSVTVMTYELHTASFNHSLISAAFLSRFMTAAAMSSPDLSSIPST